MPRETNPAAAPIRPPHPDEGTDARTLAPVVERNIRALLHRRRDEARHHSKSIRVADCVSAFAGSMASVYAHLLVFGLWSLASAGWLPGVPRFDPTFVGLATVASVEGIFLSTFVLITQNRQQAQAERQAELELQVSLLAEHEITRLVGLVAAIARKLNIAEADDPELTELAKDVWPERVLDEIEKTEQQAGHPGSGVRG